MTGPHSVIFPKQWIICSILILLSLLPWQAHAEIDLPADSYYFNISDSIDLYVDEEASLQLEDILSESYTNQFAPSHQDFFNFGNTGAAVWLRVKLQNNNNHDRHPYLFVSTPDISDVRVFYASKDGWQTTHTGASQPYSSRPITNRQFIFPLTLAAEESLYVYLRLESHRPLLFSVGISSADQLIGNQSNVNWISGLLFGIFLGSVIYNLTVFFYSRERNFLYLSLFSLAGLVFQACWLGIVAQLFPNLPGLQELLYTLCLLIGTALASLLVKRYFNTALNQPYFDLLFSMLIIMSYLAIPLALLLGDTFPLAPALFMAVFSTLMIAVCTVFNLLRQTRHAIAFFIAQAPLAIAALVSFLVLVGTLQINADFLSWIAISFASLTMIGESWAFSKQHKSLLEAKQETLQQEHIRTASSIAKSDLLSSISHSLRGPMNGILGMSELLLENNLSQKQQDYIRTIHNSGNELLNLLNETQDISKLETGRMTLNEVPFELNGLIDSCLDSYKFEAEQRDLELISYVQLGIPDTLNGDPVRLKNILLAMLAQAFRNTVEGEILLSATLNQDTQRPSILFTVKDSSSGISDQERDFLLNTRIDAGTPLEQSLSRVQNSAPTQSTSEYSLGLLISRHVINQMGGTMGIETTQNTGCRYWFALPLNNVAKTSLQQEEFNFSEIRVLVVDDNDTCRKVLTQQCLAMGMEVSPCPNGKEALALLRTKAHLDTPFQLVILDHNMPEMNGMELAQKIKNDSSLQDPITIMLTGISNTPSRVISRNAGIQRILTKPVANYTLRTTLSEELKKCLSHTSRHVDSDENNGLLVITPVSSTGLKILSFANERGLNAIIKSTTNQALEALKNDHYPLVLIDCSNEVLNGHETLQRIRLWQETQGKSSSTLIALAEQRNSQETSSDGYLSLPLTQSKLDDLLNRWLP